jgi:hypothetical protein
MTQSNAQPGSPILTEHGAAAVLDDIARGEAPLLPKEARANLPGRAGRHPDIATVFRFLSHGARAVDGSRVRLEWARIPAGRATTQSAIDRFLRRLNGIDPNRPAPSERDREQRDAERRLAAAGI